MAEPSSRKAVVAALIGNILVAATKLITAAWTGSASMFSEGVHSLADTLNEVLLLHGYERSRRTPDALHPLGYGRELYFWSFVVSLQVFALGAGVSIFEGLAHLASPQPLTHAGASYLVLALSFLFEFGSWRIALRNFRAAKGDLDYWAAIRRSKDPPLFTVLMEDTAALLGIVLAALGIFLSDQFGLIVMDGVASIAIGLVLGLVALLLARESKDLLIGETADAAVTASIRAIAAREPGVVNVNGVLTTHQSPHQIVVALSLEFQDELRIPEVEACVTSLEGHVKELHPRVYALFIKPQTRATFKSLRQQRVTPV